MKKKVLHIKPSRICVMEKHLSIININNLYHVVHFKTIQVDGRLRREATKIYNNGNINDIFGDVLKFADATPLVQNVKRRNIVLFERIMFYDIVIFCKVNFHLV